MKIRSDKNFAEFLIEVNGILGVLWGLLDFLKVRVGIEWRRWEEETLVWLIDASAIRILSLDCWSNGNYPKSPDGDAWYFFVILYRAFWSFIESTRTNQRSSTIKKPYKFEKTTPKNPPLYKCKKFFYLQKRR